MVAAYALSAKPALPREAAFGGFNTPDMLRRICVNTLKTTTQR